MSGDIDPVIAEYQRLSAELRGLVRDAHAAVKDLTGLLRDHRRIAEQGAKDVADRMQEAANAELRDLEKHLQAQQNTASADLNQAVAAAREHIVKCLTPQRVTVGDDGQVLVEFSGYFKDDLEPGDRRNRTRRRT